MNTNKMFTGSMPAIVTPFNADASAVDYDSLANLLSVQLSAGVTGIVVCGSTGESATLSPAEYSKVIGFTVDQVKGSVPVIAGIGTNSTQIGIELGKLIRELKVDGGLVVTPPYNKPPQRGVIEHFRQIKTASSGLPLIAYNIPGRSSLNLTPDTIAALAKEKLIVAVKESTGNMDQVMDTIAACEDKISILSGEDSLVHAIMACGGHGVISASQNVAPKGFAELTTANLKGDFNTGAKIQLQLLPLVRAMFVETNPIPAKVGLQLQGVIKHSSVRLPLVPALESTIEKVKSVITK
jgi:4-hydroxy-tetrahydrodipicolinate synthase